MIRTRKTGSVTMISYLSSSFVYTKVANLILWFYADIRMGFPPLDESRTIPAPSSILHYSIVATAGGSRSSMRFREMDRSREEIFSGIKE